MPGEFPITNSFITMKKNTYKYLRPNFWAQLLTLLLLVILPAHLYAQDADGDGISDDLDAQPDVPSGMVLNLNETADLNANGDALKKEGSYIEADGRINKWKYEPLFIFDDTLIHQSFNEEENLRYCAFIDIIRPSHFDNIMKSILAGVGFLLKKTRSIFYKNWKMI